MVSKRAGETAMRAFGKIFDAGGSDATGASIPIDSPAPTTTPALDLDADPRQLEVTMSIASGHTLVRRTLSAVELPPQHALYTVAATEGCVPIVAAELVPGTPTTVRWIYLVHGHGGNHGIDITRGAVAANIHVAFMIYDRKASYEFATQHQSTYFEALDPHNVIPNNNALLIYCPFTTFAITPAANIGVLAGNNDPQPVQAPQGRRSRKCLLTTAACEILGLPDDCSELATMRWYRDDILMQSSRGRRMIEDYYTAAVTLVAAIEDRQDRLMIYRRLFATYMTPTSLLIRSHDFAAAEALYGTMMAELRELLGR